MFLSIYSFRVELCFMRVVLSFGAVPALFNMLLSIFYCKRSHFKIFFIWVTLPLTACDMSCEALMLLFLFYPDFYSNQELHHFTSSLTMPKKQYILISFFSHFVECVVYFTNLDAVLYVCVQALYITSLILT